MYKTSSKKVLLLLLAALLYIILTIDSDMISTYQLIITGAVVAVLVPIIAWAFIVSEQYNFHKKLSRLVDVSGDIEGTEAKNDDLEVTIFF